MGDPDEVDDAAEERQHERAAAVEDVLSEIRGDLGRQSYPTNSEDLASTYADTPIDLPNETESIGSAFDRIDDRALYRIEWADEPEDLLEGIATTGGVVLEAQGDENWQFRLRFLDHDELSAFHNYVLDHGISIRVERTYTLTEETGRDEQFGLTQAQREALVLATERGYFDVPSETTLDELAEERGITRQALSERVRRGNGAVLREVLLSPAAD